MATAKCDDCNQETDCIPILRGHICGPCTKRVLDESYEAREQLHEKGSARINFLLAALDAAHADGWKAGRDAAAKLAEDQEGTWLGDKLRVLTPPTDPGAGCKVCGAFSPGSECDNNPCSCRCHFDDAGRARGDGES